MKFKLTKKELSWALYDVGNSAYTVAISIGILPIFFKSLTDSANIAPNVSTAYWGYAVSFATLFVAILSPIIGTISDYKNYKKRFFLFFLLIGLIATALLTIINEGQWFKCLVIYFITVIGFAGADIFYNAFLVDATKRERMDWISSLGFGLGYIGSCVPFIVNIILIQNPSIIGLDTLGATKLAFIITAVWWAAFSIPLLVNIKQQYYINPEPKPVLHSFIRLGKTLKNIFQYKHVFIFLIAYFFYIDGVDTVISMSTVFGTDIGISSTNLLIIFLATQIAAFPFAILFGILARKFSAWAMIVFGIIVYIVIVSYAYFVKTTWQFWVLAMLVASSQGGIQALSRSYFGKIIPPENSGEFFGFYNIFGKFAAIIGPLLVGIMSQLTGSSRFGVLSIVILFIVGLILMIRLKHIEKADVKPII